MKMAKFIENFRLRNLEVGGKSVFLQIGIM